MNQPVAGTITIHGAHGVRITMPFNATTAQLNEAVAAVSEIVNYTKLPMWRLSFFNADEMPPPREQVPGGPNWLGTCIVPGAKLGEAIGNAWRLGCNPGGIGFGVPTTAPDASWIGRLLSSTDIDRLDEIEKRLPAGGEQ